MEKSIGMAIRITKDNYEKLSIVNGNLTPAPEEGLTTYFFFPYDFNAHCDILPADKFFATYRFANVEDEDCFVDVDRL